MYKSARETFADNLKSLLEARGIDQQKLADDIEVSTSSISQWMTCKKYPRLSMIEKVADYFNVDVSDLNGYTQEFNRVPLLGTIAAGTPILATENIEEYFNIDSSIKADFALRIKGNSMINVGIHDKDIVFIKKQSTLENGQIGAILLAEDEKATLKRFYKADDHYILQPENNEMSPILVKDDVKILGKYVAVLHIESNT